MKIGIIGNGNHVKKNLIGAYSKLDSIKKIIIFDRNVNNTDVNGIIETAPLENLFNQDCNLYHIATPIQTHDEYIQRCISEKKNIICEKLLCLEHNNAKEYYDAARENNILLFEVCMYKYHPFYDFIVNFLDQNIKSINYVEANFCIPHQEKNDFRYNAELGGGALNDVGFYPISIILNLFGKPLKLTSITKPAKPVDLVGTCLMDYKNFYAAASWAIGQEYRNEILFKSESYTYKFNFAFSKNDKISPTFEKYQNNNQLEIKKISPENQFIKMISDIIENKIDYNHEEKVSLLTLETINKIREQNK